MKRWVTIAIFLLALGVKPAHAQLLDESTEPVAPSADSADIPLDQFYFELGQQCGLTLVGVGSACSTAIPFFVSSAQDPSSEGNAMGNQVAGSTTCANFAICIKITNPSLAGNSIIVPVTYANATSNVPTVTDDKGNTYTHCASEAHDATNNRWADIFYVIGAATGTRNIQVTWSAAVTNAQGVPQQYGNIIAADVCNASSSGSGVTTIQGGSITTTANNDLILQAGFCTNPSTVTPSVTQGSQSGITWNLTAVDRRDGATTQEGVLTTAGTINPQYTTGASCAYVSAAAAFKAGSQGTAPTGMYVACMQSYNSATGSSATSFATQLPCPVGNTLVVSANGGGTGPMLVTGVTDSSNTWVQAGTNNNSGVSNPNTATWYVPNATIGSGEAPTFNVSGTGDMSFWSYVIAGADTTQFPTRTTAQLNLPTGAATQTIFTSADPGTSSGITVAQMGQNFNTATGVTAPSGSLFDSFTFGSENLDGPEPVDENNFRGQVTFTSHADQTWTVSESKSTEAPGQTAEEIVTFQAPNAITLIQFVQCNGSATPLTCAFTVQNSSSTLIAVAGSFNATGRTVASICDNGAACGAGHAFTQATNAACSNSGGQAGDVWYFLNYGSTGAKTFQVNYSASVTNSEVAIYEVRGLSAFDLANHSNNQTASGTANSPSITTTGNPGFLVAGVFVANTVTNPVPASGNEYTAGGGIFTTGDAFASLISASAAGHNASFNDASGGYCGTNAAFK